MSTHRLPIALGLATMLTAPSAMAATPAYPAVVELFTSQGCSSCPPANATLAALADRPDVIALSFNVTYWDYLGWKDTFAKPAFTQRQVDYEPALHERGPFTPQIVVDGQADAVGNVRADVERLIARSHRTSGPSLLWNGNTLKVGAGTGDAVVWLVRYDPRLIAVPVHAGENAGVTLPHRDVVRALTQLGAWHGRPVQFAVPPAADGLKTAVLVQQGPGGAIIAAQRF